MRQNHSSFCNSGVTHPAGEVVEGVPIARIQLEHLEYVEGSEESAVFRAMFQTNLTEMQTNTLNIEEIEPAVFAEVLRFIYTDKVE